MWWGSLIVAVAVLIGVHLVIAARFDATTAQRAQTLSRDPASPVPARTDLPPAIQAFAERGAPRTRPAPSAVKLTQRAEMRMKPGAPWQQVPAEQIIRVPTSGFLWLAQGKMMRFVPVTALDAFVEGKGIFQVRLLGSIPVVNATGEDALRGELLRYLAELPWAPDAILYNHELRWKDLGDGQIEVSASEGATTVRLALGVDDNGDIVSARAEDRPRDEGGEAVPRPWSGRFWDYRDFDGYRLPARGEVGWELEDGVFTYFRGEVLSYERL